MNKENPSREIATTSHFLPFSTNSLKNAYLLMSQSQEKANFSPRKKKISPHKAKS